MRKFSRLSSAVLAAFSFGVVACDSSPTPAGDTTQTDTVADTTDTTSGETTPDATTPEATSEVTPANPCDPNPCTAQKAPTCDADGKVVTYATPGTCADNDGLAACTYAETATACANLGEVCSGGACLAGGDACNYVFDERVSYVTSIAVANQGADDTCCFDYTGDGQPDNSLGDLLKTAGTLLGLDVNAQIAAQIAGGTLVLLLETKGVEDVVNDSSVNISGFYGADGDADAENNAAGTSTFTVDPSSFQSGTQLPLIGFPGASIAAGVLTAGPNLFQLSLPIVGAQLDIAVSETKVEGDVALGPNGHGLTMGAGAGLGTKLGGVIKRDDLYAALNAFVATCTCVEFTNAADTQLVGDDGQCNAAKTDKCTDADGPACKQLPPLCGTLLAFIDSDVDTACLTSGSYNEADCDGENDAVSVGVWLKATSGTIAGVQECTP